jgi:hypothetical protein
MFDVGGEAQPANKDMDTTNQTLRCRHLPNAPVRSTWLINMVLHFYYFPPGF